MKSSMGWLGLPLAALIAACGTDADQRDFVDDPADPTWEEAPLASPTPPLGEPTMSERSDVRELANSGVGGEVTVTSRENRTEVMVRLDDAPANATLSGHIHSGTCENVGDPVQPLQGVTTNADGEGTVTSTVDVAPMTAMDGQHIVVYHNQAGAPIACAPIPAHRM